MDINEWKKLGAKTLDVSLEVCQNSLEQGVAYSEKLDFHSAIREFTVVIDIFPKLVELTKNLKLPPKMAQESAIMFVNIAYTAYSGRSLAYTQIGEKEKGNADMIMAEKVKNALTSPLQNENHNIGNSNQMPIAEITASQQNKSTNSSNNMSSIDFEYSRTGSDIKIKKYISSASSVIIPDYIDNLPVTVIGKEAFHNCVSLTSIQIPNSVTVIDSFAFCGCESLTSIQIPNSVTTIDSFAFFGCESLTSIQIPNSVTTIEDAAFMDCNSSLKISRGSDTEKVVETPQTEENAKGCLTGFVILFIIYKIFT